MKKHNEIVMSVMSVMVAAGLMAGCAEGDGIEGGSSVGLGEMDEETGDESGEGEGGGEDGNGEYMPPDYDDDPDLDPDPEGRIIWQGEAEGDLMVHATLGAEVAARYPEGVAYQIRLDQDGQALYAQIVDAEENVLDVVRVAESTPILYPSGEETVLSYCFPFPFLPPIVNNCFVQPCPWDQDWPGQGAPWPNCVEVSEEGDLVRMVGAIDGTPVGQEMMQGLEPVPMFDTPLTQAQSQRLETVALIASDVASLQPELDALDLECLDCMFVAGQIVANAAKCAQLDFAGCSDVFWGAKLWNQNCKQSCSP